MFSPCPAHGGGALPCSPLPIPPHWLVLDPSAHTLLCISPKDVQLALDPGEGRSLTQHTAGEHVNPVLSKACCGRMRGDCLKLNKNQIRYEEEDFYNEGGKALEQSPREVVDALSLQTFKVSLNGVLSTLI